ncbi:MAG TPA: twin-arginine translocase TatA/TatE family subunit, partial [Dehalococcoidia bacterium]|nr:twin-arginine translocase TatA/TatE family subunit [Dehalococcoidia bacterium]
GIGLLELILILIVLLIIVGPAKLPEVAGTISRGIRKFRQATAELSKDFKEIAVEVKDVEKEVGGTVGHGAGLTGELREVAKEIKDGGKEISTTLKPDTGLTREFKEVAKEIEDVAKEVGTAPNSTPKEMAETQRGESRE